MEYERRKKGTLLALILIVGLMFFAGRVSVFAADSTSVVASGTSWYGLTWSLDSAGTLTIGGADDTDTPIVTYYDDWYEYQSSVKKVVIEDGVTEIDSWSFQYYENLTSITIPGSVTSIGYCTFYGCSSLTGITIPDSVTLIDNYAFYECSSLTEVTIPGSVESVGSNTFEFCTALKTVTISSGVKSIGDHAFYGCSKLKSISIASTITSIGEFAFYGCTTLSSVTIPASVTTIGNSAFRECSKLSDITIPSSVTSIGSRAFYQCTALTSVTLSSGVKTIGEYAFAECSKLKSITIPSSVTSIGTWAFYDCTKLASVTVKSGLTSIPDYAFYNCTKLSSVSLPSSVTSIGERAFQNCTSLANITLPSKLKTLSEDAFNGCTSLEEITIPGTVTTIGDYAFYNCDSLNYVYINDGVKTIGKYAFFDNREIVIVRIPKSVTSIKEGAFGACYGLAEVYYGGTKSKWSSITIGTLNEELTEATFTYSSTASVVVPKTNITELQIISSSVRVRWEKSYGAKGYYIYRKNSSGSYEQIGKVTSGSTLTYTDTSVTKNTTYTYKVKAYSGSSKSAYSSYKSIKYLKGTVTNITNPSSTKSSNWGCHDYYEWYNWYQQDYSYLVAVDSGFMRVEYTGGKVVVEYYSSSWKLTSKKTIACELDYFGGFFAGEDAYYLVFGQSNTSESNSKEVIRVVKYSTSWGRKSNASVYGVNTVYPFEAGSLSMTESGGYLYIRTCHEMYTSNDGLNHQANMSLVVKESNMTVTETDCTVSNYGSGYVSHSFNQYIITDDDGNLIGLDHGDAYPRAVALIKISGAAGSSTYDTGSDDYDRVNVLTIQGDTGENTTGVMVGGLEYSSTSYLTVGASVKQNSSWTTSKALSDTKNIYITVTSRSKFSSSGTTTKWLTSYSASSGKNVSNPYLVKISNKKFMVLWTENTTTLKYVLIDGKGNMLTSIYTATAALSDCQPIYSNGYVYWYVTGDTSSYKDTTPKLYAIKVSSPSGVLMTTGSLTTPTLRSASNAATGVKLSWTGSYGATGYYIYRKTGSNGSYTKIKTVKGATTTTYTDTTAKSGTKYTYKILAYKTTSSKTSKSSYSSTKSATFLTAGKISSLTNTSSGIKVKWSKVGKATGYYIYRKSGSGSYSKVKTITSASTTSWTDTSVKSKNGTTYTYYVQPYNSSTKASYTTQKIVRLTAVSLSSVTNSSSKAMTVKWAKNSKATGYKIQYSTSSSFASGNKTVTVSSASTVKKVISSLKLNKTYYVRIRAYKTVDDTKYYSAWSSTKKVKISK